MRHDECKKSEMKNVLWEKLVEMVHQHPELQTTDEPLSLPNPSAAAASTGGKTEGVADALHHHIQKLHPKYSDVEIEAEKVVESFVITKFQQGFSIEVIRDYAIDKWTKDVQDLLPSC